MHAVRTTDVPHITRRPDAEPARRGAAGDASPPGGPHLQAVPGSLRSALEDALGDRQLLMKEVDTRGEAIVTRWQLTGRNDRGIADLGIPPNGRRLDIEIVTVDRVVNGRLVRTPVFDLAQVIAQLGDGPRTPFASSLDHPDPRPGGLR